MATELLSMRDFTRDTPVRIETGDGIIPLSVNDVLKWFAQGAPPQEALKFLLTCQAARLNPMLNEIYLVQMGSKWGTIIAKAGYLKRGQEHPHFGGFEAGVVVQAIDPKTNKGTGPLMDVEGALIPPGHLLLGGWCRVWKTNEPRPYYQRVSFAEFNRKAGVWISNPCVMIRKVAISNTFREAFNLADAYDESEVQPMTRRAAAQFVPAGMPANHARPALSPPVGGRGVPGGDPAMEELYADDPDPCLPPGHVAAVHRLMGTLGLDDAWLDRILMKRGVARLADLTPAESSPLIAWLEEQASKADFVGGFPDVNAAKAAATAAHDGARSLDEEMVGAGDDPGDDAGDRPPTEGVRDELDSPELVAVGSDSPVPPGYSPLPSGDLDD